MHQTDRSVDTGGLSKGSIVGEQTDFVTDGGSFGVKIGADCPAETWVCDPVKRIGFGRQIAARQLMFALRPRFDTLKSMRDRMIDRLMIAAFEMQAGMILDAAPVAAVKRVLPR